MREMRIFGERLIWGLHLRILIRDDIRGAKITKVSITIRPPLRKHDLYSIQKTINANRR
jgi:hypothetical protein